MIGDTGSDFLRHMAEASRQWAQDASTRLPLPELRSACHDRPKPLRLDGFALIAEIKRASPSAGTLADAGLDPASQARQYARAGAAMISVLTEPDRFGGSEADLRAVAKNVQVPVMRKDFLVDPYQAWEARAWGASAVLLIARILDDNALPRLLDACDSAGLGVLLEAFDAHDIERSARAIEQRGGVMLGLNCRDLATLHEDPSRFESLAHTFPPGVTRIAESGIATPADAARVSALGYDGVLVGSALMRATDPAALARAMIEAGSHARA